MRLTKVLFIVPPVRLQRQEFEYLIHWPRHAIVLAAELGKEDDVAILDVTAEFNTQMIAGYEDPNPPNSDALSTRLVKLVQAKVREFCPDLIAVHAHAAPHLPVVKQVLDALLPVATQAQVVVGGMAASH